ncbi:hypothetical protein [Streptomyces brevispora]|uniref:hypothetical protein n=1 Tax=Streptomyces brevispora TaxID=887462 RepID=UPI001FCC6BFC|nr:hypothetical protein [Streptomyces brevispora]
MGRHEIEAAGAQIGETVGALEQRLRDGLVELAGGRRMVAMRVRARIRVAVGLPMNALLLCSGRQSSARRAYSSAACRSLSRRSTAASAEENRACQAGAFCRSVSAISSRQQTAARSG